MTYITNFYLCKRENQHTARDAPVRHQQHNHSVIQTFCESSLGCFVFCRGLWNKDQKLFEYEL